MQTTQLLRPGFMIALHSSLKGGVHYKVTPLVSEESRESVVDDNTAVEEWKTRKTVDNVEEHEAAVKVRGAALYLIRKHCIKSPFGLLCPEVNEAALDSGVVEANLLRDDFNEASLFTKIELFVMKGRIATSDEQAAKAIAGEMRNLLAEMSQAIKSLDPEAIAEAATKAKEMSQMLAEEQQEKVSAAIETARAVRREIAKNLKRKGQGAIEVAKDYRAQIASIEEARTAFLDFEEPVLLTAEQEAPGVAVKELDLGEETAPELPFFSAGSEQAGLDLSEQIDEVTAQGYADKEAGLF